MPRASGPAAGDPVRVVMSKWGGRPHWEYDAVLLGTDAHGAWIGVPAGTHMSRPGAEYVAPVDQVVLARVAGPDEERAWVATFHAPGGEVRVYVDIATPPIWRGHELHAVDLDLDVVQGPSGRVWVDDEDEFARHRVQHGYPDDVVRLTVASRDLVLAAVTAGHPPFDGTASQWLARLSPGGH